MDFVSLVKQGGLLWKAWVACHYERRLKRQDYLSADLKSTCEFLIENLREVPLRCLGHLMLGILRILLRQAEDLESKADEVRTSLQTSLSAGLPTVPTLAASAVTLRNVEQVHPLDFGGVGGLDALMEELPEMEIEASLEEGRRHVAPLELITLSPEPASSAKRSAAGPAEDDFGAPSAEDLASLAAMGQVALAQIQEEACAARDAEPTEQKEAPRGSPGPETKETLPPIDFLLGAASPGDSPPADILMQTEGGASDGEGEDLAAAAEAAALEAEAFAAEAEQAAADAEAAARCLQEGLGELPVDFLLRDAEEDVPMQLLQPLFPPNLEEEACLDLLPRVQEEALQEVQEAQELMPRQKRRRKRIWLDDKATHIPDKKYDDPKKITHENALEYGLLLPHQSPTVGLTTFLGDLCPLLCAPLRRAADIGARRRRARAEDSSLPSPPKPPLGQPRLMDSSLPATLQEEAEESTLPSPPKPAPLAPLMESSLPATLQDEESTLPSPPKPVSLAPLMDSELPAAVQEEAEESTLPSPPKPVSLAPLMDSELPAAVQEEAEESTLPSPPKPVSLAPLMDSELPAAVQEEAEESTLPSPPKPVSLAPLMDSDLPAAVQEEDQVPASECEVTVAQVASFESLPPAKRQAHQNDSGELVAIKVPLEITEVKIEEGVEADLDKVSAKQGRELRASLPEEAALSFLDLCDSDQCSAEAAACRFVDLLSLHMSGAVTLQQDVPYADITVVRGTTWEAWCEESRRGTKRESLAEPAGS
ncbi:RAD21L1 [Symbiodinium natans]|uniref:RAD21L1 protein n=1 Tax=Symbiodinium natans TaxID=878477 RepID=A0A812QVQ0_9DINO|nr:RAD21L1 [Symbiodinium natans]